MKDDYLKKTESKKDLEIKKYKRRSKSLFLVAVIVGAICLIMILQNAFTQINGSVIKQSTSYINKTNSSTGEIETVKCENPSWVDNILSFIDRLFSYPTSFWTKLFIFLGVIYVIQIAISLTFDVIELFLLVFVAIKRFVVWCYKKITGKDKKNEQLKKVELLLK